MRGDLYEFDGRERCFLAIAYIWKRENIPVDADLFEDVVVGEESSAVGFVSNRDVVVTGRQDRVDVKGGVVSALGYRARKICRNHGVPFGAVLRRQFVLRPVNSMLTQQALMIGKK